MRLFTGGLPEANTHRMLSCLVDSNIGIIVPRTDVKNGTNPKAENKQQFNIMHIYYMHRVPV